MYSASHCSIKTGKVWVSPTFTKHTIKSSNALISVFTAFGPQFNDSTYHSVLLVVYVTLMLCLILLKRHSQMLC